MLENLTEMTRKYEAEMVMLRKLVHKLIDIKEVTIKSGQLESSNSNHNLPHEITPHELTVVFIIPSGILTIEDLTP